MEMKTKKIALNILSAVLFLAVIFFLADEFVIHWQKIREFEFRFNFAVLGAASAVYVTFCLLLGIGWNMIFRCLHVKFGLIDTVLCFCTTYPAKYIPGKIWTTVSRMKFCATHKVPHSMTILSSGIEGALEILA